MGGEGAAMAGSSVRIDNGVIMVVAPGLKHDESKSSVDVVRRNDRVSIHDAHTSQRRDYTYRRGAHP